MWVDSDSVVCYYFDFWKMWCLEKTELPVIIKDPACQLDSDLVFLLGKNIYIMICITA